MKKMEIGDLCFFYHSVKERDIVGIVKVVKKYHPDIVCLLVGVNIDNMNYSLTSLINKYQLKEKSTKKIFSFVNFF